MDDKHTANWKSPESAPGPEEPARSDVERIQIIRSPKMRECCVDHSEQEPKIFLPQEAMVLGSGVERMSPLLLLCVFSTFAMTGLIWLIQRVSYPLMGHVPAEAFPAYEAFHCERITPVVLPLMTIELVTSIWLAWKPIPGFETPLRTAAALAILLWVSTFVLQVPLHQKLEQTFDSTVWQRLVGSNWIRTIFWSARSVLLGWVLYRGGR